MNYSFEEFIAGMDQNSQNESGQIGLWLQCEKADVGGRITVEEIDRLKDHPNADTVTISGLRQDTFDYFIKTYGKQLRAVRFFKNRYVEDWSLLGSLPQLEYVDFFMNHRITSFWDMRGNTALSGLRVMNFSRLTSVEGVSSAPALRTLIIGNVSKAHMILDSLLPLAGSGIEKLSFSGKDILNKDLSFLSSMPRLKVFDFPSNLYSTEQVAWISANFPDLTGYAIRPYIEFTERILSMDDQPQVNHLVIGRRKPFLRLPGHENRLRGYAEAFETLKKRYAGFSYAEAFPDEKTKKKKTGKLRLKRKRAKTKAKTKEKSKRRRRPSEVLKKIGRRKKR